MADETHSTVAGYIFWIFGFTGSHRFFFGKPVSGFIWLCTLGLLGVGWLVDLFLIPGMASEASRRYRLGPYNYNLAWALFIFLGVFGVHRFYLRKWPSGVIYLLSMGLFGLGILYDFATLNEQIHERNVGL